MGKKIKYYHFCPKTFLQYSEDVIIWPSKNQYIPSHIAMKPCLYSCLHNQTIIIHPKETICAVICRIPYAYHLNMDIEHCIYATSIGFDGNVISYYLCLHIQNVENEPIIHHPNQNLSHFFSNFRVQTDGVFLTQIQPFS
jgi:hypothetical protein